MKSLLTLLFACILGGFFVTDIRAQIISDEEQVTFYPTYGYQDGDHWVIPMRLWVHERRALVEDWVAKLAGSMGTYEHNEIDNFRSRISNFMADSKSGELVSFKFDNDPRNLDYRVQDANGNFPKTDHNGLVIGVINISLTDAKVLLLRQGSQSGWLSFRATSREHAGVGRVRLLESTGLSVISDIDDTIKITEIPAGSRVVVRNTFFHDFHAAPEMAKMYQEWSGASFHYVSGGPWQLYPSLAEFLFSATGGFPEGTFHMKNIRKNLLNADTWEDLKELVTNENITLDQKITQITEIIQRFPERKFILVGDSGEKDPEVYREIKKKFPGQIQEIRIRDVVNDRERNNSRLEGMTIIPAPTVN